MHGSRDGANKLKALRISAAAIFSVVIVEVTVGLAVNSLAIVSDGLHALLDALTSVMLFFAVRASLKPPDEEHTYGHEKFETIGGLIGGLILIAVALLVFYEAVIRLFDNSAINLDVQYVGFFGIGYALFIASLRISVFKKLQNFESSSMKVGLYDSISDLGSTVIALLGFGLAIIGLTAADAFASIFLGAMLTYLSVRLVKFSVLELSDTASKDLVDKVRRIILSCDGVVTSENLKVRKVGSKIFIDSSIKVPSMLNLEEAHSLATRVEECLNSSLGSVDATIHIEPSEKERKIEQLIKKIAIIDGIQEVHDISTNYVNGKLFITLHAYVNPEMSVEEAHKLAEKIEKRMHSELRQLQNVTVHLEPGSANISAMKINEEELKKIINEVVREIGDNLRIKRVVTYTAEGKRYVNIDCCFIKQVQIRYAHKIASQIEKETKEHFTNAVVTVHIEPFECS
jgi:cation diffusion facilitator family transporter